GRASALLCVPTRRSSDLTLYDVGFNHFWRGLDHPGGGDLLYIQGHSSPGIYARSFLEGRIDEKRLDNFREETGGEGLSSYPHPRSEEHTSELQSRENIVC